MKNLLYVLTLLMIPSYVIADASLPPQTIKRIETGWGNEGLYISTNEGHVVEGCVASSLRINTDNIMFDKVLSIALSAFHTKSKVQFRVSGCIGNQMKLIAIAVLE